MPTCLSIQSLVAAGHVGHGASAFVLAAMGIEVWPVPTVVLSGHAATPGVEGRRLPAAEIEALGRGLAVAGALSRVDAGLTGYLGTVDAADAVADLLAALRAARPRATILVDPVLGDDGRLYLPQPMIGLTRDRLLPLADIATPNMDELGWLTGLPCATLAQIETAARALGPATVFVTSVSQGDEIGILAVDATGAHLATAIRRPARFNGAGDATAALLLGHLLAGRRPAEAAAHAVGALDVLVSAALEAGRDDLPVVAAAEAWRAAPPRPLRPCG